MPSSRWTTRWCARWWTSPAALPPLRHRDPQVAMLGDYDVFHGRSSSGLVLNAGLTAHLDLCAATTRITSWRRRSRRSPGRSTRPRPRSAGGGVRPSPGDAVTIAVVDYAGEQPEERVRGALRPAATGRLTADPDEVVRAAAWCRASATSARVPATSPPRAGRCGARGATAGRPVMGICLGLQLLFETSEEAPDARGIGLLPAECALRDHAPRAARGLGTGGPDRVGTRPSDAGAALRRRAAVLLPRAQLPSQRSSPRLGAGHGEYGATFPTIVGQGPAIGAQFHPEKSQRAGIELLDAFALGPMTSVRVAGGCVRPQAGMGGAAVPGPSPGGGRPLSRLVGDGARAHRGGRASRGGGRSRAAGGDRAGGGAALQPEPGRDVLPAPEGRGGAGAGVRRLRPSETPVRLGPSTTRTSGFRRRRRAPASPGPASGAPSRTPVQLLGSGDGGRWRTCSAIC